MEKFCFFALLLVSLLKVVVLQQNPAEILQDARVHPLSDGTFGFLYKTEDGIAHGAKGDSNGIIHGRYSYTDDTGFKFSSLYNAGLGVVKGSTPDSGQYDDRYHLDYQNQKAGRVAAPVTPQRAPAPQPRYQEPQQQPQPQYQDQQYQEPAPQTDYNYDYNVPVTKSRPAQQKYPQKFEDDFQQTFGQPQAPQQRYQQPTRYTDTNTYDQQPNYGRQSDQLPRYEGPAVPSQNWRSKPPALRGRNVNQYQNNDY